jgi:hypothetical protein
MVDEPARTAVEAKAMTTRQDFPIGQRIALPGHFPGPVVLESVRSLGAGYECRVRLADGTPDEAILSPEEAHSVFGQVADQPTRLPTSEPERLRLVVESARIRLAYAHDKQFAVSLSGIRTLPHQIEAVYIRMLPQPRLRFLLADDPGAGKTIMAGLLIKEMKLRQAIERVLILCPAPLTIQWQDELLRWFGEPFDIIFAAVDQHQLVNPWQRSTQIIASLDYAKQDDVRERVWQPTNAAPTPRVQRRAATRLKRPSGISSPNGSSRKQTTSSFSLRRRTTAMMTALPTSCG